MNDTTQKPADTQDSDNQLNSGTVTVIALLALIIPAVIIFAVAMLSGSSNDTGEYSDEAIAARIAPVASYNVVVAKAAPANKEPLSGEQVYNETCHACHGSGLAGSPKFGDQGAWAPRIAEGQDTLFNHALHGFKGMPARGGNADLSDLEVERAVVYMANKAGASFKEPAAPAKDSK